MNKIVREHYPVENLPEDLRAELGLWGKVTLTIVATPDAATDETDLTELLRRVRATRKTAGVTPDDATARVRALRDEWDDR